MRDGLEKARQDFDAVFGKGYAAKNPAAVVAYLALSANQRAPGWTVKNKENFDTLRDVMQTTTIELITQQVESCDEKLLDHGFISATMLETITGVPKGPLGRLLSKLRFSQEARVLEGRKYRVYDLAAIMKYFNTISNHSLATIGEGWLSEDLS